VKLHLLSSNLQIQKLCQDVLAEFLESGWTLYVASTIRPEDDADLFIWDIEPGVDSSLPAPANDKWRHFFLIDRVDIEKFQTSSAFQDANILLKPVTRAALAAFLSDACKRCSNHARLGNSRSVDSLRADRDEILQCLIQANLNVQEYDCDRTNFLARAIHDFRAPLTAITGYCGLLLGDDLGRLTEQQREVIERMHHSARKLSRMATAMFQLSIAARIETPLDFQRGDIRECIQQALHEVFPTAEEKRVSFSVDTVPEPEALFFERSRLEQVLVNLLDNACKFVPRVGNIEIRGYPWFWDRRVAGRTGIGLVTDRRIRNEETPNCYRVEIWDNGPGIPPAHITKVFEEYTSYVGGGDRSGGGLGLAICRMIINQHKGRIWAESNGNGAVFSFVLPFHRTEPAQVPMMSRVVHAGAL